MQIQKLSIIIPAYNEENTITEILARILVIQLANGIQQEIIIVNDGSTDGTEKKIKSFTEAHPSAPIHYFKMEKNGGKGAAVKYGVSKATGEYVLIQDADLEYDPRDYNLLLDPVLIGDADVVFGSRFVGSKPHRIFYFWHSLGNKILTSISNIFTNLNLTDMEVCYKLFKKEIIQNFDLKERGFGFEPEVTAKVSKIPDIKLYEVGVSYFGRTYKEGKKINWRDGIRAIYCIIKYNL